MAATLRLSDVFVRVGVPQLTFVEPSAYRRLVEALRTPGLGIVIEGPSGIGKTTATTKAIDEAKNGHPVITLSARVPADRARIAELPHARPTGIIIIDDFHILDESLKADLVDYLKALADEGALFQKLVLIGINKTGKSLISISPDVAARLEVIQFETESIDKVLELIDKGCEALNIDLNTRDDIARESNGSFLLAQMLSYETCLLAGVVTNSEERQAVEGSFETVRTQVMSRLRLRFHDVSVKFASGTRLRQDGRAPYLQCLRWLAQSEDWAIDLNREMVHRPFYRHSVDQIVSQGYLARLIDQNEDLQSTIHYAEKSNILSAEDPQFIFYIRNIAWNTFAREVGFTKVTFESKYDVALSFAGHDRDIAESLFKRLCAEELSVFYDRNEQYRIAGEDVEEYLQPIYESEAEFVAVVIGSEYPNRVWTRFESKHFADRFGDGVVIPIWVDPMKPTMFDSTEHTGGYFVTRDSTLDDSLQQICNDILKKLRDRRAKEGQALPRVDDD